MAQVPITPIINTIGRAVVLSVTPTSACTGGTAVSIPADTLAVNDRVKIEGWITKAGTAQAMTVSLTVGGTTIGTFSDVAASTASGFSFEMYVTGASAETSIGRMLRGDTNIAALTVTSLTHAISGAIAVDVLVSAPAGDTATLRNICITAIRST